MVILVIEIELDIIRQFFFFNDYEFIENLINLFKTGGEKRIIMQISKGFVNADGLITFTEYFCVFFLFLMLEVSMQNMCCSQYEMEI